MAELMAHINTCQLSEMLGTSHKSMPTSMAPTPNHKAVKLGSAISNMTSAMPKNQPVPVEYRQVHWKIPSLPVE